MRVSILSSGSKGNSTVIITNKVKILLDIGTTCSYVEKTLKELEIDPAEITHILITHNHVDHIKGLKVFVKKYNPVVHVTEKLKEVLEKEIGPFKCYSPEVIIIVIGNVSSVKEVCDKETPLLPLLIDSVNSKKAVASLRLKTIPGHFKESFSYFEFINTACLTC